MIKNEDYFEIIKEQNKELARFRPFKSAYEMKQEIERLNNIIEDINIRIEQRMNENISDELRIELRNIELISRGIIKVVKDGE